MGWDFMASKEASAQGAPGSGGSEAKLDAQTSDLHYYVRFEGVAGNQWLQLEDFDMGLSSTASITGKGGGASAGKLSADEVSLLLGSSKAIVELSEALVTGELIKNVEVEAYASGGEGKQQLVDEFWFENVILTGLHQDASLKYEAIANEVDFTYAKFSHGHIEQKADGSAGPHTEAGWDFTKNDEWTHGPPHADIDFLL
jgi:type VI secretion system secreted protein Hcp